MNNISKNVDKTFTEAFGNHPVKIRLEDISNEFHELVRYKDYPHLKEKTGDLLASLIQLCNEQGWDPDSLIQTTLDKIDRRKEQYKTLRKRHKIAVFGGAMNPITEAHVQCMSFVLNASKLFDEIWVIPCYQHLYGKDLVDPELRLEMCKLATQSDPRIKVVDYEIRNKLSGKAIDLFQGLIKEFGDQNDFSMVIGMDNANTIQKWADYETLLKLINFVVIPRKGIQRNSNDWYLKSPHIFLNFENQLIECSSTEVREAIKTNNGEILEKFVNKDVLRMIKIHKLYLKETKETHGT